MELQTAQFFEDHNDRRTTKTFQYYSFILTSFTHVPIFLKYVKDGFGVHQFPNTGGIVVAYAPATGETRVQFPAGVMYEIKILKIFRSRRNLKFRDSKATQIVLGFIYFIALFVN